MSDTDPHPHPLPLRGRGDTGGATGFDSPLYREAGEGQGEGPSTGTAADRVDALVIGGGFYGCSIALQLKRAFGLARVCLVEREDRLMARASYANQARLHNGYHYPRSLTTAYRSRVNMPRFVADHPDCIVDELQSVYAVARRNSKVTARQFAKFCQQIGAEARPASRPLAGLFSERAIEASFLVTEYAFDTAKLRAQMQRELAAAGVGPTQAHLKFEITEMALIEMPDELAGLAVTVMDGPFFSTLPFPDRGLHTLSHVRYTPHFSWTAAEADDSDPYAVLAAYDRPSRAGPMLRDAARYLPALAGRAPVDSL